MAHITHRGNPVHTIGDVPAVGSPAPDFVLTRRDLSDVSLADFQGKKKILNIVPSLDTKTCATSARTFENQASEAAGTVILTVSNDLPYAQDRFCKAENIETVITLSQLRNADFGRAYGVEMTDGKMAGLLARSIVVLDEQNIVLYTELVPEISREPDYRAALDAAKS